MITGPLNQNERTFELSVSSVGAGSYQLEARSTSSTNFKREKIKIPEPIEWKKRLEQLQIALKSKQQFPGYIPRLREAIQSSGQSDDQSLAAAATPIIKEIGQDLFQMVFVRSIWNMYCQEKDLAGNKPVRLRLCFLGPGLSYLPWETLYDGSDHLALSPKTPIVRGTEFDSEQNDNRPGIEENMLPDRPELAILGMVPRVKLYRNYNLAPINVEAEQDNIKASIKEFETG